MMAIEVALSLIVIGMLGALLRRNMLIMAMCMTLAFAGVIVLLTCYVRFIDIRHVLLPLLLGFALVLMAMVSVCVLIYRHLGTLHLDELRSLRD